MQLGIFAKTFPRPTIEETLDEVAAFHIQTVQFNFACVGLPAIPASVDATLLEQIKTALDSRAISVAAVSGTFNLIDPVRERRQENLRRLGVMARACLALGATKIALSTGTRDEHDMWRWHPDNSTPEAWRELLDSIRAALAITEVQGVTLLVEPEPGNVISNAVKARQLLDEIGSPRIKVLFDAANLLAGNPPVRQHVVLDEAFRLLGPDIALAHGKEWAPENPDASRIPGKGNLDWSFYVRSLDRTGYAGPFVLHGFQESAATKAIEFVRAQTSIS